MLSFLIIGLFAAVAAAYSLRDHEGNFWRNLALGICGALVGSIIFEIFDFFIVDILGAILFAFLGAFVLIWIFNKQRTSSAMKTDYQRKRRGE